jgi:hypothetical protein
MVETVVNVRHYLNGGESEEAVHTITVGEVAQLHVLRSFNVTDDKRVDLTKVLCAALIQQMIDLREAPGASAATKRAASIAITQMELVQMPLVKANFAKV